MKPFAKILVPHDLSAHADHALEVAADLARRYEARVSIVHVVEPALQPMPGAFMLYPSSQLPAYLDAIQQKLEGLALQLRGSGVMVVDTKVLDGVTATEIVRFAAEGGYDLVVMGTHGRSGVSHALLGSVAERVVRTAKCPVLTSRMDAEG